MRILVTGSRTWDDTETIRRALFEAVGGTQDVITVVHGHCPHGADRIADDIAVEYDWLIERHPAWWKAYGKKAGYIRNAEMVKLGADICLAFIRDGSRGATMCADLAEKSGIPVERIYK